MINKIANIQYLGFFITSLFFLYGCTYGDDLSSDPKKITMEIASGVFQKNMQRQSEDNIVITGSEEQRSITKREINRYSTGFIDSIDSLDSLFKFSPSLRNDPQSSHPKFLELQKKIILLNILTGKLENKQYNDGIKRKDKILEGRAIWTKELIDTDKSIQEKIGTGIIVGNRMMEIRILTEKKTKLMNQLRDTEDYKKYLQSQEGILQSIDSETQKYLTPEIISLKNDMNTLSAEVYGSGTKVR